MTVRDPDIRRALHHRLQQQYAGDFDTEIVDEMSICRSRARADVAVINGHLGAFEIKSDADRLDRLSSQIRHYERVFDRMSVVCTARHLDAVIRRLPDSWGIVVASSDDGPLRLSDMRPAETNVAISVAARAQMLHREPLIELLRPHHPKMALARKSHSWLFASVLELVDGDAIAAALRRQLRGVARARPV